MKKNIIKRLAGIMALLMLASSISLPVYAMEENADGSTTAATDGTADEVSTGGGGGEDSVVGGSGQEEEVPTEEVSLSEEVTVGNVVDVLSDDMDSTSEEGANQLVDEAVEDLVSELSGKSDDEVASALQDIESDISDALKDLESEISKGGYGKGSVMHIKLQRKIRKLHDLRNRLKAKLLKKHVKLLKKVVKERETRKIYEVRWGNLVGKRQRCKGLTLQDLRTAIQDKETPEKCQNDVTKVDYSGKISVNKGTLKVHRKMLFEKNDEVITESGSSIAFKSNIAGHWDGLIVEYTPNEGQDEKAEVTITIGELDKAYIGPEVLGRKKIGNGHMIEIKNLAQVMHGLSKNVGDKLVQNKVKIQEKADLMLNKIDRFRLLNKGGEGVDELEEVIEGAGEYNFDDQTAAEVQNEIDNIIGNLGDSVSKEDIAERAKELRTKLMNLKSKAKGRKFVKKMIPFKDTDDDQWYTGYVSAVKNRGIISGYKDAAGNDLGEFRPGNNITVAEILKIGLETAQRGKKKGGNPKLRVALNHWAKEYVAQGEELGLDLVGGEVDLNRPATRGEVVRMMLEALGVNPDEISKTTFSDLKKDHKHAKFIEYAKELGIVSGDSGKTTFRPNAPINRAEAAKISNQILETFVGGAEEE